MGGGKTCYLASKLSFIEVLFGRKKLNLGQYLNQSERGKTKVICSAWQSHSVISL